MTVKMSKIIKWQTFIPANIYTITLYRKMIIYGPKLFRICIDYIETWPFMVQTTMYRLYRNMTIYDPNKNV